MVKFFTPYPYRSPFYAASPEEETDRAIDHLERVLSHEGAQNVAALMLEPVSGSSGMVVYPDGYLDAVRRLCTRYGILLIFDEIMTGFGRTGAPFAATRLGVQPDLITFAKGASSSYVPLGGVLVRESVASHFDTQLFDVGHTHAGHVLSVAAGLAAYEVYRDEGLIERWLKDGLTVLKEKHPIVGDIRGLGAHFGIELVKDRATREPLASWHAQGASVPMRAFYSELMRRGVHAYGRYNLVLVTPPLTIGRDELEEGFVALDHALRAAQEAAAA
jgi:taurine--2-oxoglutarate transaminase